MNFDYENLPGDLWGWGFDLSLIYSLYELQSFANPIYQNPLPNLIQFSLAPSHFHIQNLYLYLEYFLKHGWRTIH